ncbi:isoleucine--tRNA ligase [Pseudenhygromyxa sp. WMMC2535]|uniref:isoleucine--tRNA ligase n=1 Tax=Pseudenhygromyxa sp. WMMC2535 TaxID=2712867 RepID=UPI001554BE25|nr:isoleucine--tRNA ligase [Pseudenhygromyxa sp. WMMC2535]NVB37120.1 isoleucine--tRNA ligase [Pseudenhygromyxa sp. WMMC2535]
MEEPRETGFEAPPAQFDLPAIEHEILALWRDNRVEARSLHGQGEGEGEASDETPADKPEFVFYDGPPFATGLPHYGHLLAGTIKDVIPRYWAMKGYHVERRFGWDCHGLPIESLVEDQLDVHGGAEIEALGVPEFNAACRAGVLRYTAEWRSVVQRMGRWVDFDNDYKTMDTSFMESVWWVFSQLWGKGLIYEGHRVQPVSPLLGTPLSNFEVAQGPQERNPKTGKDGHKLRQDPSVTLRFRVEPGTPDGAGGSADGQVYLWAWTTTPWTLPSNLALAVHPEVEYALVEVAETGERAWIEPGRLADYQARGRIGETRELTRKPGAALVGLRYEPLLPFFADHREREDGSRWAFRVVAAEYVTTDSGTGIVHQAPAFGEDDFLVGQAEDLPLIRPMNLNGVFDERVGEFAGLRAKDADKAILARLKAEDKLVDQDTLVHAYPHCYRTDEPLLYMAISTWFMKVEQLRDQLIANNEPIRWVPEHVGSGRFGNWLAGARDWNLSRNRYWGTPLPVWRCDEDPEDMVCVGSIAELEGLAGLEPGTIDDLHRERVDEITFPSQKTPGGTMRRVKEVFDCWFESGSMPYAQNHYPFDAARKTYVESNLPANFIAEGLDQTRGWFYTLHVLATALFGRPAFENVVVNGLILAADGKKMSKRLKNYPDPMTVVERYGADALRAYLISGPVVRAEPMRFGRDAKDSEGLVVRDMVKAAILPLFSAYNFLVTYARADGWTPAPEDLEGAPAGKLDRWIFSRVQSFVSELRREFEAYNLDNLVPAWLGMCDELNNWYIRRGRRRYWRGASEDDRDKREAYATLYRVLVTIARCMAPVLPFFCEHLYQRLVVDLGLATGKDSDSVHLQPFPEVDEARIDPALEAQVALVRKVVGLAMGLRERERIGVRRPLASLTVASRDAAVREAVRAFEDDVLAELNVKSVAYAEDDSSLVALSAKANFKVLGRRLGKKMKVVAKAVETLDGPTLRSVLEGGSVELEGETLGPDDLVFRRDPLPGRVAESEAGITVVLDTNVDEALEQEGLARELINRVQGLRKTAELDVSDRIALRVACGPKLGAAMARAELHELVASETLCAQLEVVADASGEGHSLEDEIDGEALTLSLSRAGA